jgi:aryl-alcohol dehydrogenase-like predicted oxidoreductase
MAAGSGVSMTRARLALGTAQLAMDYGVANATGRPSADEAERILRTSVDLGVEYIDTAAAYGEAESIVGRFLNAGKRQKSLRVGTKLPRLPNHLPRLWLRREVNASIDRSRARLGVDAIDDLLVHAPGDLLEYGEALTEVLAEQQASGKVKRVGVSIYDPPDVRSALCHRVLSVTQFPFNVLDQRFAGDIVDELRSRHAMLARSPLLQGLLTLEPDQGQVMVPGSGPWLRRFHEVCAAHGAAPLAAAVGYAATRSGAEYLIVGVESADQLRTVASALDQPLPEALVRQLDEDFGDVPSDVRDPRRWRDLA